MYRVTSFISPNFLVLPQGVPHLLALACLNIITGFSLAIFFSTAEGFPPALSTLVSVCRRNSATGINMSQHYRDNTEHLNLET